ncbi:hypothetical protein BJV78DRAFT_1201535 [Lactifluus subvellereus]|nr:hypothetical protein BJV78DRAFT_1201535 [Lactifluus subvellereus]
MTTSSTLIVWAKLSSALKYLAQRLAWTADTAQSLCIPTKQILTWNSHTHVVHNSSTADCPGTTLDDGWVVQRCAA